jgi:transposase
MADRIRPFLCDQDFSALFSSQGQPGASPLRLALVTILQYVEGLTDRQADDAVRSRIDWKYLLCLELTDTGFDRTVLSEFRTRLIEGQAERLVFEHLLSWCQQQGWLQERGRQRTDSTHVLGAIRAVTRLECAGSAVVAPDWLQTQSQPEWIERYSERMEDYHLPISKARREQQAQIYGADGKRLLDAILDGNSPDWLRQVPAVETLRRVWVQQYYISDKRIQWRTEQGIPPATVMISSPYDLDAHYSKKNTTSWVGYKVHVSETCEPESVHLITNVETTTATIADGDVTESIHTLLAKQNLLPNQHIVDTGYLDAELLVASQSKHQVELLGPTRSDLRWQAKAGNGFAASDFQVDWQQQIAICPQGKTSTSWSLAIDGRNNQVIKIKFARPDCANCPSLHLCTRSKERRRSITLRPEEQYKALQRARQQALTDEYKADYALRAGIEGTLSEGIRAHGLRRARYIGLAKTHLQHLMTATAINFKRIFFWISGVPQTTTRTSQFAKLMAQSAS